MPDAPTPWIGLAALAAMFLLPFLPAWVFDGPRRIKHWPRDHICAKCDGAWTDDHSCSLPIQAKESRLHWELHRLPPPSTLERRLEKGRPHS
jgi:hypothetical protein